MGSWYRVIKTIKGRRYLYDQRTRREGKHVRTESRYIGPAGNGSGGASAGGSVNTTEAGEAAGISPEVVDGVFADLTKPLPQAGSWSHGWEVSRVGDELVRPVRAIDRVVSRLRPKRTSSARGAYYNPRQDALNVPPRRCYLDGDGETATQAYYATLLHELAHWTGHESRLNRLVPALFWSRQAYAREELVAEATAISLLRHFEAAPDDLARHADYFQGWLISAGDKEEALAYAREEARRAVNFILGVNTT